MPVRTSRLIVTAALAASACGAVPSAANLPPGELLVRWADATARQAALGRLDPALGARTSGRIDALGITVISCHDPARTAAWLSADPSVAYAEVVSALRPGDTGAQAPAGAGWNLIRIEAAAAWVVTRGAREVLVAVLDTGVDESHPAFKGRLAPGRDVNAGVNGQRDAHGHGTEVASVLAGTGVGVAPGVRLLPIRITGDSGLSSTKVLARGIVHATDAGARILNISMAGPTPSRALQDAVAYARARGALVIAAAGNGGGEAPSYPAGTPGTLAVGATDPDDALDAGSSHGWHVGLVAPGRDIRTAVPGGGWGGGGGTSLAAPHVAGVAALVMSAFPSWTADQVRARLIATADDLGAPGEDPVYGHGRLNARRAVAGAGVQ